MGGVRIRLAAYMGWENIVEHPPPHSSLKGEKRQKGKNATKFLEIFSEHLVLPLSFYKYVSQ